MLLKRLAGVVLIAKFCVNIAFFRWCTHSGHITTSPYAKWLNTNWASYGSLVAATLLNTRSTCKLSVIKDSTATQLTIYSVISAVALHFSLPLTSLHSMKGGIWTMTSINNSEFELLFILYNHFDLNKMWLQQIRVGEGAEGLLILCFSKG